VIHHINIWTFNQRLKKNFIMLGVLWKIFSPDQMMGFRVDVREKKRQILLGL
jgi:hypothetical protein